MKEIGLDGKSSIGLPFFNKVVLASGCFLGSGCFFRGCFLSAPALRLNFPELRSSLNLLKFAPKFGFCARIGAGFEVSGDLLLLQRLFIRASFLAFL